MPLTFNEMRISFFTILRQFGLYNLERFFVFARKDPNIPLDFPER